MRFSAVRVLPVIVMRDFERVRNQRARNHLRDKETSRRRRLHRLPPCRSRCAGFGWARAGSGGRARSPLAVAGVLAQWLEAHRR